MKAPTKILRWYNYICIEPLSHHILRYQEIHIYESIKKYIYNRKLDQVHYSFSLQARKHLNMMNGHGNF